MVTRIGATLFFIALFAILTGIGFNWHLVGLLTGIAWIIQMLGMTVIKAAGWENKTIEI